jgi:hypothetical protein
MFNHVLTVIVSELQLGLPSAIPLTSGAPSIPTLLAKVIALENNGSKFWLPLRVQVLKQLMNYKTNSLIRCGGVNRFPMQHTRAGPRNLFRRRNEGMKQ